MSRNAQLIKWFTSKAGPVFSCCSRSPGPVGGAVVSEQWMFVRFFFFLVQTEESREQPGGTALQIDQRAEGEGSVS